jgi:C4-dicarboxylate-specific signal transduction histidine kinase
LLAGASRELNTLKKGLESQVAERTAALRSTNDELINEIKRRQESENQLLQVQKMEAVGC